MSVFSARDAITCNWLRVHKNSERLSGRCFCTPEKFLRSFLEFFSEFLEVNHIQSYIPIHLFGTKVHYLWTTYTQYVMMLEVKLALTNFFCVCICYLCHAACAKLHAVPDSWCASEHRCGLPHLRHGFLVLQTLPPGHRNTIKCKNTRINFL